MLYLFIDLFYPNTVFLKTFYEIYAMLKPSLEPIQTTGQNSFLLRQFEEEAFSAPYHFHPEYELTLITKGEGRRYIGNNMDSYIAHDLVFIGPNLPHCWKTEPIIKGQKNAGSIVIHFKEDFLGADFFKQKELIHVKDMLDKSSSGISFEESVKPAAIEKIIALMNEQHSLKKLLLLLELLDFLSASGKLLLLNGETGNVKQSTSDKERINAVLAYIIENFKEKISLEKASSVANMTTNSFCKYFKKITRKTFMDVVIEYRLNYATKQLVYTDKPVSHICFESGFNDIAHFSRMFKQKMKSTPLEYRKHFRKNL